MWLLLDRGAAAAGEGQATGLQMDGVVYISIISFHGNFCIINIMGGRGAGMWVETLRFRPTPQPAGGMGIYLGSTRLYICSLYNPFSMITLLKLFSLIQPSMRTQKGHYLRRFLKNRAKIVSSIRERPV